MDAFVQLALIEKSKRVFATDASTFLGFPILSPLTFTPQTLAALSMPKSNADYAAAADFARAVNFIPRDMVASMDGDRYLWDIYADVLARAVVATGGASGSSGNASTILHTIAPDGAHSDSAEYIAYRQYRDAWIVAREDYGSHKLSGEMSKDTLEKKQWIEVEEPALRAVLAKAEVDWKVLGHRDQIEAALQAEVTAAADDPSKRWLEWNSAFMPDIDLINDPGGRYAPTGLSPRDFTDSTTWPQFEMSAAEMNKLVAQAPPELKHILDGNIGGGIEHVSFEYRSVALVRPWFRANALTSRIWRSNDPDLILSNGTNPPSGSCPAYVTAVVFVRNLKVTHRASVSIEPDANSLRFTIKAEELTQRKLQLNLSPTTSVPERSMVAAPVDATTIQAFRRLDTQSLKVAPTLETAVPLTISKFAAATIQVEAPVRIDAPALHLDPSVLTRSIKPELASGVVSAFRRSRISDVIMPQTELQVIAIPVEGTHDVVNPAGPPKIVAVPVEDSSSAPKPVVDEISVLAFICKRLPKTPDANPDLNWI